MLVVTSSVDHRGIIHLTCPSPFHAFSIITVNCYTFGDPSLLRCYITSDGKQLPTFQIITVPSSSSSPRNLILVLDLLDPEDEHAIILQEVGNCISMNDIMPQKTWLFSRPSHGPEISQVTLILQNEQLQAQRYLQCKYIHLCLMPYLHF